MPFFVFSPEIHQLYVEVHFQLSFEIIVNVIKVSLHDQVFHLGVKLRELPVNSVPFQEFLDYRGPLVAFVIEYRIPELPHPMSLPLAL